MPSYVFFAEQYAPWSSSVHSVWRRRRSRDLRLRPAMSPHPHFKRRRNGPVRDHPAGGHPRSEPLQRRPGRRRPRAALGRHEADRPSPVRPPSSGSRWTTVGRCSSSPQFDCDIVSSRPWTCGCASLHGWRGRSRLHQAKGTVKASNLGPQGNLGIFLASSVAFVDESCTKNEQNRICRSKGFLKLSFSSFFCRTRFNDSKPFWERGPKFPRGPKLVALTVIRGIDVFQNRRKRKFNFICIHSPRMGGLNLIFDRIAGYQKYWPTFFFTSIVLNIISNFLKPRVTSDLMIRNRTPVYGWSYLPLINYYWTDLLILDQSYFVGNLTNSKIAGTKALRTSKFLTLLCQQF